MSDNNIRESIRSVIFQILNEEADEKPKKAQPKKAQPKKKKTKKGRTVKKPPAGTISIRPGGIGRGNFSKFVKDAKMRAEADPEGLLKDLGVKGGSGDDLSQVAEIFNQAIHTNDTMGEAYSGAALKTTTFQGKKIPVVAVTPSGLNLRNGIKFLSHTLTAAQNIGMFSPSGAVVFSKGENFPVIVYSI